jgi:hypothetical protein
MRGDERKRNGCAVSSSVASSDDDTSGASKLNTIFDFLAPTPVLAPTCLP